MKIYSYILTVLVFCFAFYACEEVPVTAPKEPSGPWNVAPLSAAGLSIENINGGAIVTYEIPNDPDIMYVMAEYERNGKIFTEKSSIHHNTLSIEGFHRVDHVKAKLYKVNKFEQRSEPLEIEFEPKESVIDIASKTIQLMPGFGGITAIWENPLQTELGARLMTYDDSLYHRFDDREMVFSTIEKDTVKFRGTEGYPPVETLFGLVFEDKWGNVSDTIEILTTPFFETMIPKPYVDFRAQIPFDNITNLNTSTYNISKLWDGIVNTGFNGWLSQNGGSGLSITIDMKQTVKLSRILHHFYHVNAPYGQANVVAWEIWGTDKIDFASIPSNTYWLDSLSLVTGHIHNQDPTQILPERTFKDDWQYLGYHQAPYYTAAADRNELAARGNEMEMPLDARPVRYIRFFVRKMTSFVNPPLSNYFSCGELSFYGDNTIPQE